MDSEDRAILDRRDIRYIAETKVQEVARKTLIFVLAFAFAFIILGAMVATIYGNTFGVSLMFVAIVILCVWGFWLMQKQNKAIKKLTAKWESERK